MTIMILVAFVASRCMPSAYEGSTGDLLLRRPRLQCILDLVFPEYAVAAAGFSFLFPFSIHFFFSLFLYFIDLYGGVYRYGR